MLGPSGGSLWTRSDLGRETPEHQAERPWMRRWGKQPRCEELQVASLSASQVQLGESVVVVTLPVNGVLRNSCCEISD